MSTMSSSSMSVQYPCVTRSCAISYLPQYEVVCIKLLVAKRASHLYIHVDAFSSSLCRRLLTLLQGWNSSPNHLNRFSEVALLDVYEPILQWHNMDPHTLHLVRTNGSFCWGSTRQ